MVSLTLQSARVRGNDTGALHYPVLTDVIERASVCLRDGVEDTGMPIVNDVASAWQRSVNRTREAKKFGLKSHNAQVSQLADSDRNVDLYHWSSAKFSSTWYDTLSVLVAKGRAKVSVAASEADWSKRIREMQYADYEDRTTGS